MIIFTPAASHWRQPFSVKYELLTWSYVGTAQEALVLIQEIIITLRVASIVGIHVIFAVGLGSYSLNSKGSTALLKWWCER